MKKKFLKPMAAAFLFAAIFNVVSIQVFAQCTFTTTIAASGPTTGCGSLTLTAASPGNTWTPKSNFGGSARQYPVGFSIGTKGYIGTGYVGTTTYLGDFWEFDPATNAWTQKANFGGTARYGAVGFTIGSKGYIGTGYDGAYKNDFWEFDPSLNTWTQKAYFGGAARYLAAGFGLNSKGYIGTGTSSSLYADFWEYDPGADHWTQKTNFGGGARYGAVGLGINTKGYIGTGYNAPADFWEFDPAGNSWTQKANMGTGLVHGAVAFTLGNTGFVATGVDYSTNLVSDNLWQFDPSANTWLQLAGMGTANARYYGAAFAIGTKGYVGTGFNSTYLNTFWEYEPTGAFAWSTGAITSSITASGSNTYSVLVTTAAGCTTSATQTVALSPNPAITVSGAGSVCQGISSTLAASGASTYTWSANAGGSNSGSISVTPSVTTTYTLSGTTGSCTVNYPVTVNINAVPAAGIAVSGPTLGCGTLTLSTSAAGNVWTQKAGFTSGRAGGVAFSIGSKGYLGTGSNSSNVNLTDFWEYDPATNAWTQKANFAGGPRYGAVGFNIGAKGYIGTGYNYPTGKNDFWEYDPTTNLWTQKASIGSFPRYAAAGFGIGSKGYIGTGAKTSGSAYVSDFWEYDPASNTWTQKASYGGGLRYGTASFVIGSKGYIGTGYSPTGGISNDLWEYNPTTDTWTQKANYGGPVCQYAIGLGIAGKGYIGTGGTTIGATSVFWEYDATANSWTQKASFGGGNRYSDMGFAIGSSGYIGMGYTNTGLGSYPSDFWQYDPSTSIAWSTGSTLQAIPVSASGMYSLTITNAAGCTAVASQSLSLSPNPTLSISGGTNALCAGNSSTLIASGASTYTWSANAGNATTSSVSILPASSMVYIVSGATNGCTATATRSIVVNALPVVTATTSGTSVCQGASVTLSGSGATTYSWTGGAVNNTAFVPAATLDYTVTGADLNNCTNTAVVSVTVKPSPTVSVNSGSICAGQAFTLVPSGAVSYTYSGGSAVVTPASGTSYSVTGFNAIGCPNAVPAIATVSVYALPVITANSGVICIGNTYTIAPGGATTYTYSGGSAIVTPTANTSYSVSGTSTAGCISASVAVANITVSPLPTITVNSGTICSGQSFTLNPSGAATYTYSGGSAIVTPIANATYSVTGANAYGCTSPSAAIANLTVLVSPTVSVNSGSICAGQAFTLVAVGAASYTYSGGSAMVTPTANTSYSISGTSTAGCISASVAVANITVSPLPTITVNSGTICNGQSFTLNASGAATYTYSGGSAIVTPVVNTTYSVTGANAYGCISAAPAISQVTVSPTPVIVLPAGTIICAGNSYTINPAGAATYTYSGNSNIVAPVASTSYTVSGTSAQGCQGNAAIITVSVQPALTITINGPAIICQGQSVTLNGNGASSYAWSNGASGSSISVSPVSTTVYSLSASDGVCSGSALHNVTVNATPTLVTQTSNTVICTGETASINVSGASSYTWDNGSAFATIIISPAITSTYTVTGTSANGCSNVAVVTQSVSDCTGIAGAGKQDNTTIHVYPNPNNGMVTLESASFPEHATVELYDYTGQLIATETIEGSSLQLNYKHAANGIYTLRIMANNACVLVTKIIKQ